MLTPPRSSVGSGLDGWWDTSTSLTAPGEAGGGVFLLRVVARGVGSCFWLRQDPRGFVPPLHSQSQAGQQNARGWECWAEGLGAFGSPFTPQVCSVGQVGAPLGVSVCWSCCFTPGVTLGNGRTHGTLCPAFLLLCWDK